MATTHGHLWSVSAISYSVSIEAAAGCRQRRTMIWMDAQNLAEPNFACHYIMSRPDAVIFRARHARRSRYDSRFTKGSLDGVRVRDIST